MKKFTTFIAILLLCVTALFAQSPEKFSYQAVVRNANNALVTNTPVGMRVSILQGSATGTPVYVETHTSTTNANGLLTVEIGGGNAQQGAFASINWEDGPYFLKTETDPNGGTNYSVTSTQQLLSVPYALYAKEAANSFSGDYNDLTNTPTIPTVPTNVSAFTNDAGYLTGYTETDPQFNAWDKDYNDLINKPQIPTVPTNVSAFVNDVPYLTSYTEQQVLSISNDTIFLTGGSFVKLPAAAVGFSGDYNDLTNKPTIPTVPTNVSAFNNDAGYLTGYTETDPQFNAWNKDYNDLINTPQIPTVPTNVSAFNNDAGYITSEDIPEIPTVPTNVSAFVNDVPYLTSYTEQQVLSISNDTIFLTGGSFVKLPAAAVGFSGDYNDLVNAPEIPTVPTNVSAFTNDAGYITGYTETDPQFNAWDKDYNDLINTPEIPTVPTNVSAFTNDAGYITNADIPEIPTVPTNVSAFTNDANYITAEDIPEQVNADWEATEGVAYILNKPEIPVVPENVSTFTNDAGYLTNADLLAVINALNARIDSLQNQLDNGGQGGDTPSHHDDFENAQLPTVVTLEPIKNISQTLAQASIMVLSDGGGVISQVGVCYDTTATPTVANDHIGTTWMADNFSNYSLGYALYPLIPGKTYYVRAYATNNKGTAYGNVVTFTTLIAEQTYGEPCSGAATLTDIDGNEYNTVQIGEQCWMRESLRTTHTPSGEEIPLQNGRSLPSGGMPHVAAAGYIYTYSAAMNGASSSNTVPSGVQGICPDGWHLPSNAEWQVLHNYASSRTDWLCGNGYYGKALAAATEWTTSTYDDCDFGNNMLENNKSGFTALTTLYLHCSGNVELSSTGLSIYNYTSSGSVRCLRDPEIPPVVILNSVAKQSENSIKVTSEVAYGGAGLSARGVCWGTEENPTVESSHTTQSGEVGAFESEISGLAIGTLYYIRSYATNNYGTAYSEQQTYFVSPGDNLPCQNAPTVTDIDNNTYNTVQIGQQCWMKENLRTTRYADGTNITFISGGVSTSDAYYSLSGDSSNVHIYGYLYNWKAVMGNSSSSDLNPSGVQGICPVGWHVPSDAEWTELTDYVSSQSEYVCGNSSSNIAKALSATFGWLTDETSCAVGNDTDANNATGFSACPAGYYYNYYTQRFNQYADFWSSTQDGNVYENNAAWYRDLDYRYPDVSRYSTDKVVGHSVRCLRDGGPAGETTLPSINTTSAKDVKHTSTTLTGLLSNPENASVSVGFEWKSSNDTSYSSVSVGNVSTGGEVSYLLTGLTDNTDYIYRAFVTASDTTLYGSEMAFHTLTACPSGTTVSDIDNNTYSTLLIGNQCWMAENLRTTRYADGTAIAPGNSNSSSSVAYYYVPDAPASYGYLYNWKAVMHNSASSQANPSGVQGICPMGWHVPSDAEWQELTNYVGSQSQYLCNDNTYYIAKSLAAVTGWNTSNETCVVGNNPEANNATGFNALPAGYFDSYFYDVGISAYFWSATEYSSSYARCRNLGFEGNIVGGSDNYYYNGKDEGYSVRCIHNGDEDSVAVTPTIQTLGASNYTSYSVTLNGILSNPDNSEVTSVGFEWKMDGATDYTTVTVDGITNGIVSHTLSGLSPSTSYTYRAFMTILDSTVYGEDVAFTAQGPCPNAATVTDVDGNVYNTVQIGNQCWMKENLRVKHYADGTDLMQGNPENSGAGMGYHLYYYANEDSNEVSVTVYGLLYNWYAVMGTASSSNTNPSGVQGICPAGWHLPSHAEWGVLRSYVSATEFLCEGVDENAVGKSVASEMGWNSSDQLCDIGCQPENNNITGFSAYPAGRIDVYSEYFGERAMFWSSTEYSYNDAYCRFLNYLEPYFYSSNGYDKDNGMSVRCVRGEAGGGETSATLPTVTTATVSDITETTATCGGNVTNNGGATVTARGVCWSTSQNPTLSDSYTTDGNGTGAFNSNITGLTANTTYYVRAYATNSVGTAYGSEVVFTTEATVPIIPIDDDQPCDGGTVTDIDGNTYNTVQIGLQCWMKENLRTTRYSNGTSIPLYNTNVYPYTSPYYCYSNNDQSYASTYGCLYNWIAVMGNSSSSSANPSGVQGICPTGWHVPSDAEWTQLTDYVKCQSQYVCGTYTNCDNVTMIAKALASALGWSTDTHTSDNCVVGNNPNANNATGFSVLPAGYFFLPDDFYNFGYSATFWSATISPDGNYGYDRSIGMSHGDVYRNMTNKINGLSVRCLRNEAGGGETSATLPTVTTATVSDITETTASCGGNVTNNGGATVTARGVCWSTSQNPTLSDSYTTDGNGTGAFNSNITGLTANTTYYVRAYATNSVGTAYGSEQSFTTSSTQFFSLPTVTTATVSNITETTATCGGEVTNNGGAAVTVRGVCWSTSQNPTLSDSYTTDGNGTGAFNSNITGLTANTTYYVRAYATNSVGTAYGSEQSFTTNSTCNLLNENFDNGAIPTGWTTLDSDGDGHFWSHNSSSELSTSLGHDGSSGFMTSASYMNNIGALTPDNWLISPAVTITNIATLSFWVKPQDANYRSEHYGVYVTTSNDYTNSDNYTLLFDETITQSGWEQKTVSLQDYAGQTVHIAFRHFNCSDWFYLEIDDVTIQYNCSTNGQ